MGRSVNIPSNAVKVAYAGFENGEDASDDFDYSIQSAQEYVIGRYPSFSRCSSYVGNDGFVFLENEVVRLVVSEYCGLVAVSVIPRYSDKKGLGLSRRFANQFDVQSVANYFGQGLVRQGSFSNGSSLFQPINGQQSGSLGLGFVSGEGFL